MRPYNDPDYRAFLAHLRQHPQPCWVWGCPRPATTADHTPPVALHDHRRGTGCCTLRPACPLHNYGEGRRISLARRAHTRRPGWSREW